MIGKMTSLSGPGFARFAGFARRASLGGPNFFGEGGQGLAVSGDFPMKTSSFYRLLWIFMGYTLQ